MHNIEVEINQIKGDLDSLERIIKFSNIEHEFHNCIDSKS